MGGIWIEDLQPLVIHFRLGFSAAVNQDGGQDTVGVEAKREFIQEGVANFRGVNMLAVEVIHAGQ